MIESEVDVLANVDTLARAERVALDAKIAGLEKKALALTGNMELNLSEFDELVKTILECSVGFHEIRKTLIADNTHDNRIVRLAQIYRNKIKEALSFIDDLPINGLQTEDGTPLSLNVAELGLYRYFELRVRLNAKISRARYDAAKLKHPAKITDPDVKTRKFQKEYDALRTSPVAKLIPQLKTHLEMITAKYNMQPSQKLSDVIDRFKNLPPEDLDKLKKLVIALGLAAAGVTADEAIDNIRGFFTEMVVKVGKGLRIAKKDEGKFDTLEAIQQFARINDLPELEAIADRLLKAGSDLDLEPESLDFRINELTEAYTSRLLTTFQAHFGGQDQELGAFLGSFPELNDDAKLKASIDTVAPTPVDKSQLAASLSELEQKLRTNELIIIDGTSDGELGASDSEANKKYRDKQKVVIQELMEKLAKIRSAVGLVGGGAAAGAIDREKPLDQLTSQELYNRAKSLWPKLMNKLLVPLADQTKGSIYNEYLEITAALTKRGVEGAIDWGLRARYLENRVKLHDADAIGTGSAANVDYNDMWNGKGEWHGLKSATQFNEEVLIQLLYGHHAKIDMTRYTASLATGGSPDIVPSLESPDSEERDRIKYVDQILQLICKYYSDFDPVTKARGKFHCTATFSKPHIADFEKEVEKEWKATYLGLSSGAQLSNDQEEAFSLAWSLASVLDIRTYYGLPFSIAGWSPNDNIGNTIGLTAERFANGKGMYAIAGKADGMVTPRILVQRFSSFVRDCVDAITKLNQYDFATNVATPIWADMHAPWIDNYDDLTADELFSIKGQPGNEAYAQGLWGVWPPHKPGEAPVIPADSQIRLLTTVTTDPLTEEHKRNQLSLQGMLFGAESAAEYVKACEAGYSPTGDMHNDVEGIVTALKDIAMKISPTKNNLTIDGRFLANMMYLYARTSILAFGEKYHKKFEYHRYLAKFITKLRSGVEGAPTAEITIGNDSLPDGLRKRLGLPLQATTNASGKPHRITVKNFVLALLPEAEEGEVGSEAKFFFSKEMSFAGETWKRETFSHKEQMRFMDAIFYLYRYTQNNQEAIHHLKGEKHRLGEAIQTRWNAFWRQGGVSKVIEKLHHHPFVPIQRSTNPLIKSDEGRKDMKSFFNITVFKSLTDKEKQPEGKEK